MGPPRADRAGAGTGGLVPVAEAFPPLSARQVIDEPPCQGSGRHIQRGQLFERSSSQLAAFFGVSCVLMMNQRVGQRPLPVAPRIGAFDGQSGRPLPGLAASDALRADIPALAIDEATELTSYQAPTHADGQGAEDRPDSGRRRDVPVP